MSLQEVEEDILNINNELCFLGDDNSKIVGIFNWRSEYDNNTLYNRNDLVKNSSDDNLYVYLSNTGATGTSLGNTGIWELVVTPNKSHTHLASQITDFDTATDARITLQKGQTGGLATLDANGQVPSSQAGFPGTSLDKEIAIFDGTDGRTLTGSGRRDYGASASDPSSPTPQAGDRYYNTVINHEMCYDGTRSKWLSVTTFMDGAGRNGTTTASTFYRRWNGMILASTLGPHVPKGTIVRIGYSTSTAATHTYEVLVNGSVVASLASGGAASAFDDSVDADFNAGVMSSRNASGGSTTSNFQSAIYYKLRA